MRYLAQKRRKKPEFFLAVKYIEFSSPVWLQPCKQRKLELTNQRRFWLKAVYVTPPRGTVASRDLFSRLILRLSTIRLLPEFFETFLTLYQYDFTMKI